MRKTVRLSSFVLSLLLLTSVHAQVPPATPESKEENEKAQKALENKALKLLDSTLADSQMLKLVENRALFQSVAADLLWARDEKRARALFQEVTNSIALAMNSKTRAGNRDDTDWRIMQLRFQTIQTIARRDPQLALDLLRSSRPVVAEGSDPGPGRWDQELALEQSIASQAAENDPKRALEIAEESLKKGTSPSLLGVLQRLQKKDSDAAKRLGNDIVKKLQTEDLKMNQQAALTAVSLLQTVLRPNQNQSLLSSGPISETPPAPTKPLELEEQTVRDLAEVVVNAAFTSSPYNWGLPFQLQSLLPDLERLVPTRATQLRQRLAEFNQTLDPESKSWMKYEAVMREGSVDKILATAAEAPSRMRNFLYTAAAAKLLEAGDVDRAQQIVTDNVNGPERDNFLTQINRMAIAKALKQGKIDDARQMISRLGSKEKRASALAELAIGIVMAQGDRKVALELLDEARKLVNAQPDNQKQLDALLQVAAAYAVVEPTRAFELIDPLIDQANDMLSAAALLDKFGSGQGLFKQGEMVLSFAFSGVNGPYLQYLTKVTSLARADFERTRASVDRFQRNEARLMGRLLIAQSVLSDHLGKDYNQMGNFVSGGIMIMQ